MDPTTAIAQLTREQLLRNIEQSGLLNEGDLDRVASQHPSLDMLALGQRFVSSGMLTHYQLERICQGLVTELKIGNYEILDRLGVGGMGTVYKSRHRRMKRIVALKVLLSKFCRDEAFVTRFQREVETIAKLGHPNIVMAYDADVSESGHFLVMEFVEGRDLSSLVQKNGPLDFATAIGFIRQACLGLDYAHSMNVIHRDIKPANLLCDRSGIVKITDLGLARISVDAGQTGEGSDITQAGFVLGTPGYMPPEQALDPHSLDQRADIYSLGATLFYLLTGQTMYDGPSAMAVLIQHRDSPIPWLSDFRPDVPPELEAVFRKMVQKHPHDRFSSMTEVVGVLDALPGFQHSAVGQVALPPAEVVRPPRSTPAAGVAPSIRILFVERSRVQLAIFRKYVEAQGITHITVAANGARAFEIAAVDLPDAIVCSLALEDMSGVELIRKVRGIAGDRPPGGILISSGTDSREEAADCGLDRLTVLLKPFTPDELVKAINHVTGQTIAVRVSDSSVIGIPTHKSTPRERSHRSTAKVLIVDDSSTCRLHERLVLQQLGFAHFVDVADAQAGIDAAKSNPFDLIVTDYNMPLMNGDAMISLLRRMPATASVPIIMVTTESDSAKLNPVRALRVEAIFGKAFRPEDVAPVIDRLFVG